MCGCGADRFDGPGDRPAIGLTSSSVTQEIIFGESCAAPTPNGIAALLVEGEANFGGGLETIHTVICSAVLIRPGVALTAAHCLDLEAQGASFVGDLAFSVTLQPDLRSVVSDDAPFPDDTVLVVDAIVHPEFDAEVFRDASGLSAENDIAVLFLATPFALDALPTLAFDDSAALAPGSQLLLAGYGTTDPQGIRPQDGTFGRLRCVNSFVNALSEDEIQTGSGNTSGRRCDGDSGGPTFLRSEPNSLVAIGSRSFDQAQRCELGSVDTLLAPHAVFVSDALSLGCQDGGPRTDCDFELVDAGRTDAGDDDDDAGDGGDVSDAGEVDAGDRDAGLTDAGAAPNVDGGAVDGGRVVDAGTGDSGPSDVVDAGRPDGGALPPPPTTACSCSSPETAPPHVFFGAVLLVYLRRRTRPRPS